MVKKSAKSESSLKKWQTLKVEKNKSNFRCILAHMPTNNTNYDT